MLVRQFDQLDDMNEGRPWLPCPTEGFNAWCGKFAGMWAASIIARGGQTFLYLPTTGGLVLAPTARLFCAYSEDGNSMDPSKLCSSPVGDADRPRSEQKCVPGCYPPGQQCAELEAADKAKFLEETGGFAPWDRGPYVPRCSYPPEMLKQALEANLWLITDPAQKRRTHNEMVVDLRSIVSNLPGAVEGLYADRWRSMRTRPYPPACQLSPFALQAFGSTRAGLSIA